MAKDKLTEGRYRVLKCLSAIEVRLDQMDPKGTERYKDDYDASGQLSFLTVIQDQLMVANTLLRDAAMEGGHDDE